MKIRILVLTTLLIASLVSQAAAYKGVDLNWIGGGVRARAMGGAFTAIADDASAVTWNPAGLIQLLDPQVSFSGAFVKPRVSTALTYPTLDGGEFAVSDNIWRVNYASFLAPLKLKGHQFSLSIAYRRLNEIAFADMFNPYLPEWLAITELTWDSLAVSNLHVERTGGLDVVNLGFGTYVWDDLSIGSSANLYLGSSDFTETVEARWSRDVGVQRPDVRKRLFRAESLGQSDFFGFDLTFGAMYKISDLRLGLVVRTPFQLKESWEVIQNDTTWETKTDVYVIKELKADFYVVDQTTKLDIPLSVAIGAAYQVTPNLLISADVEWRRFGTSEYHYLDSSLIKSSGEKEEYFSSFPAAFRNGGEGRVGFEYTLQTSKGIIPLRGGFRYIRHYLNEIENSTAYYVRDNDDFFYILVPALYNDRTTTAMAFSAGAGIHWDRIWLDAAIEHYTHKMTVAGFDAIDYFGGDRSEKQTSITVSFTGFF